MSSSASCPFCDETRYVDRRHFAAVIKDMYPVTEGHHLIVPRRCQSDFFKIPEAAWHDMFILLHDTRTRLMKEDPTIEGFTVGINVGEVAGQTVSHAHVHIIPRRRGDVEAPRGGVRGVIPGKKHYKSYGLVPYLFSNGKEDIHRIYY
jgi:diadenosine tetraphosphate (Ap4A) HIT family hydrolase